MEEAEWFVYIIECLDGSYYVGMTRDVSDRFEQHLTGLGSKYTGKHGIRRVAYMERYDDLDAARIRELQIKGWRRSKKEKLINGEWGMIGV